MKLRLRVPLVAIALGALFLYFLGKWSEQQGHERAEVIARAEVSLRLHDAFVRQQAKYRTVSRAHATSARIEMGRIVLVAPLDLRVRLQAVEQDWEAAFRAESLRADNAEARVADLERNLRATVAIAECRMLGLRFLPRCPSRTVSAVLGLGVGATVVILSGR